jgi:NAD(P) transhydrogenase subunit alpha
VAGQTVVSDNGVTLIGAGNLPSGMPTSASQAFGRNVSALFKHLLGPDGQVAVDLTDEIQQGVVITHGGQVVHAATAAAIGAAS